MGIQGLIPFLKKASRTTHLHEFKGKTAAIDAYCWLHKGAFSCADKLAIGEPTDGYVLYVLKLVNLLLSFDIKPIMVFDGAHLPSKATTEAKRRENRERNRKKAKELLREGRVQEARDCFQRCVDITPQMASEVIKACRLKNVDVIVAPYEADAQLAFLNKSGIAQLVITEDSDLVLFGCNLTLFKLDSNGGGILVEREKLHLTMKLPRDKFIFERFVYMCVLSGCDYLPSLHGIGLAKACKFFTLSSNPDIFNALCRLPSYLKMPQLEVTEEYRNGFIKAVNTFLHQLVFDPLIRQLRPLTDYPTGSGAEDFPYAGKFIGHERALQIALGNINVCTGEVMDSYNPDAKKKQVKPQNKNSHINQSIWNPNFNAAPLLPSVPDICDGSRSSTKGKQLVVTTGNFKRKISDDEKETRDLISLYSNESKKRRIYDEWLLENLQTRDKINDEKLYQFLEIDNEDEEKLVICEPIVMGNKKEFILSNDNFTVVTDEVKPEVASQEQEFQSSLTSRNPFAKTKLANGQIGKVTSSQFSALRNFSRLRTPTLTRDPNIVVQSRFFSTKKTHNVSTSALKMLNYSREEEDEEIKKIENEAIKNEFEEETLQMTKTNIKAQVEENLKTDAIAFLETPKSDISPVTLEELPDLIYCKSPNISCKKSNNNLSSSNSPLQNAMSAQPKFKWGHLSDMFSYGNFGKIDKSKSSEAELNERKGNMLQHCSFSDERKENWNINASQQNVSQTSDAFSQSSVLSDIGSITFESFGLTPSPIEGFVKNEMTFTATKNCRQPGLSKKSSKPRTVKQMNLKEMFSFRTSR